MYFIIKISKWALRFKNKYSDMTESGLICFHVLFPSQLPTKLIAHSQWIVDSQLMKIITHSGGSRGGPQGAMPPQTMDKKNFHT